MTPTHYAVIIAYVFAFDKSWEGEWELLRASPAAETLGAQEYPPVVLLSVALAYPTTHWIEPRIARWLEARLGLATARSSYLAL